MKTIKQTTLLATLILLATGCSLDRLVRADDPEEDRTLSEEAILSREGGLGLYANAIGELALGVSRLSEQVSLFTDELALRPYPTTENQGITWTIDFRWFVVDQWGKTVNPLSAYPNLHSARNRASQARDVLSRYNDPAYAHLLSATYAIEGMTMVMLAENLCSGSPISRVPLLDDAELGIGLSNDDILDTAIARFDSSLAIVHDTARIRTLARIGRGRALIARGKYQLAAEAVSEVLPGEKFEITYTTSGPPPYPNSSFNAFWTDTTRYLNEYQRHEIINSEGVNGMTWFVDANNLDPRVPVTTEGGGFPSVIRQTKMVGSNPVPIASWIDAKMIQAEYLLSSGSNEWLTHINEARNSIGLSDTTDPGTANGRVNLIFRERAYWHYLEGQRLASLRRLVRQYGRSVSSVYGVGPYFRAPGASFFGDAYVFTPPSAEYVHNYRYEGCDNLHP